MDLKEVLQKQSLQEIRRYVSRDPLMLRGKDEAGTPYSYYLVRRGELDLIRWLVEYSRADMNESDARGRNILFPAIETGLLEPVRYFCERVGLDPMEADRRLLTPLEYAAQKAAEEAAALRAAKSLEHAGGAAPQSAAVPFKTAEDRSAAAVLQWLEDYTGLKADKLYKNPVRRGFSPDPSVVRVGADYYMVNSSFLAFPALPISHSRDLVHWRTIGHAVSWENPVDLRGLDPGRGFWAPDISYHEGSFYVIVTLRLNDDQTPCRRQMVVSARDPAGPWSAPRFLEEDGIDPSVFRENGKTYVLLNRGVRIFETDESLSRRLSETRLLYYGALRKATEAPHLIKHNNYYYLFMAEGGTGQGHTITVARAKRLEGPYEACPYNPLLSRAGKSGTIQRTGHGKPFRTAEGEWYIAYLGARQYEAGYSALGRETFLDKLTWNLDGWPVINGHQGPSAAAPLPLPTWREAEEEEEGFGTEVLSPDWYFIRGAQKEDFALQDGVLSLKGSPVWPDNPQASPILLRRQREACTDIMLTLVKEDLAPGEAAGLLLYYDENSWYFQGIERRQDGFAAVLRKQAGPAGALLYEEALAAERQYLLKGQIRGFNYRFAWTDEQGNTAALSEDFGRHLCDEGLALGKRFTGPAAGPWVKGEGRVRFRSFREQAVLEK